MSERKSDAAKLGEYVAKLFKLFDRADKQKLEAAINAGNLTAVCETLDVAEEDFKKFLGKGAKLTKSFLKSSLAEAVKAFRKSREK